MVQAYDAIADQQNKYGTFYRVEGDLIGSSGTLAVVTVWLERTYDGAIQFITLKPKK
nr:hypothetical protein [cf. Phormidesmis sp. LEGE 11477]